jgi:hypothetical protein
MPSTGCATDADGARAAPTRSQLSRLLRFRHFFRHAYRIDLLWLELAPLAADLDAIVVAHRADIERFCAHPATSTGGGS